MFRRLRNALNWTWRTLTSHCVWHDHELEDMGGVIYLCCKQCPWVHDDPVEYSINIETIDTQVDK